MHRSGTSCLAACLEQAGLYFGPVNRWAPFNKKGNLENRAAMAFNDRVLARVGAAWNRPPATTVGLTVAEETELEELLARYPRHRAWGLKDPRLLLLFEAWNGALQPRLVGTFRHPLEVARSLMHRATAWGSRMSEVEALELWRDYNERLLSIHRSRAFPMLQFVPDRDEYQHAIARTAEMLGLVPPASLSCFDRRLRHFEFSSEPPPCAFRDLWEALLESAARSCPRGSIQPG